MKAVNLCSKQRVHLVESIEKLLGFQRHLACKSVTWKGSENNGNKLSMNLPKKVDPLLQVVATMARTGCPPASSVA